MASNLNVVSANDFLAAHGYDRVGGASFDEPYRPDAGEGSVAREIAVARGYDSIIMAMDAASSGEHPVLAEACRQASPDVTSRDRRRFVGAVRQLRRFAAGVVLLAGLSLADNALAKDARRVTIELFRTEAVMGADHERNATQSHGIARDGLAQPRHRRSHER